MIAIPAYFIIRSHNIAAMFAAKNPILGVRRPEAAAAHFGIDPQTTQRAKQQGHINYNHRGNAHAKEWPARSSRAAARCAS